LQALRRVIHQHDQKELIMAKWRFASSRKEPPLPASHAERGSAATSERTKISRGYRGSARLFSGARVGNPQGWRSTFMSL
jgi:hypothetical protein